MSNYSQLVQIEKNLSQGSSNLIQQGLAGFETFDLACNIIDLDNTETLVSAATDPSTGNPGFNDSGVATTYTFVSGSGFDLSPSLGAHSIRIVGLNAAGEEIAEVLALNGTTNVTTANQYTNIKRIVVWVVGGSGTNSGNIVGFSNFASSLKHISIKSLSNVGYTSVIEVPPGKEFFLSSADYLLDNPPTETVIVRLRVSEPNSLSGGPVRRVEREFSIKGEMVHHEDFSGLAAFQAGAVLAFTYEGAGVGPDAASLRIKGYFKNLTS